jgi:hypothetical protein
MAIVGEVLYNRANIDVSAVANALCRRISKSRRIKNEDDTLKLGSSFQYELVALRPSKYDPYLIAEYREVSASLRKIRSRWFGRTGSGSCGISPTAFTGEGTLHLRPGPRI